MTDTIPSPVDAVQKGLDAQRKEGSLCDVTITVDETQFHAHKCVLAAASQYFKVMFDGDFKERSENIVNLKEVISAEGLKVILDAIYTPYLCLSDDSVVEVAIAADYLQIEKILAVCEHFMCDGLFDDLCAGYFQVASKLNLNHLAAKSKGVISRRFVSVSQTSGFRNLDMDTLCEILAADDLVLNGQEIEVFRAVCSWLEDKDLPEKEVDAMLTNPKYLQYTSIPKKVLKNDVLVHKLINNCARQKHIKVALEFHGKLHKQPILLMGNDSKIRGVQCLASVGTKRRKYKDAKMAARPRLQFFQIDPSTKSVSIIKEAIVTVPFEQGTMCCITYGKYFIFVYGCCPNKGFVFLRYNVSMGTWLKLDAPPLEVKCAMMTSCTRTVYLMGGIDNSTRRVNSGFEYIIEDNAWKPIPRMPALLSSAGICIHSSNDTLYIAGGCIGWALALSKVNTLYAYNIKTMTWFIETPMHYKRSGLSLVEINGRMYAIGGLESKNADTSEIIEEYNITLNQWTVVILHCQIFPHLRFPSRVKVINIDGVVVIPGIKRACDCSDFEYLIEMNPEKQFKLKRAISVDPDFKWDVFGCVRVPL